MSTANPLCCSAALAALLSAVSLPAHALYDTEMLQDSGPSENRVDLVIMGDGYRAEDAAQLRQDALNSLAWLFGEEVFGRYRDYINVKLVYVESNQTGADNGSAGQMRDTALNAHFFCSGIERLLCVDDSAVLAVAMEDAPEFDQVLIIVNDSKYGGAGGQFATASLHPESDEVAIHELGHSLFDLADEYSTATPGWSRCSSIYDCPEPNVTVFSDFERLKWNHWVELSTPLPTPDTVPYDGVVGAFEGARYFATDQFRPVRRCKMHSLGQPFCPVCAEAGTLSVYSFARPIDVQGSQDPVFVAEDGSVELRVEGPRPNPNTLEFRFFVDGSFVEQNSTGMFTATGAELGAGVHDVSVEITDTTELVRLDSDGALHESTNWALTVGTPQSEVVVDNASAGFSVSGSWGTSTTDRNGAKHGADYRYDNSGACADCTATWTPSGLPSGKYEVYMWWVPSSNRPDAAPVTVTYDTGCQTNLTVNQSGSNGANQWNLLAVVDDPLAVTLSGADAGYTTADAVRFVRLGAAGGDGCGCTPPSCGSDSCGTVSNSCGSIDCGGCATGETCSHNVCQDAGPSETVLDNGDVGFSVSGSWGTSTTDRNGAKYGANYRYDNSGACADCTATWTPSGLPSGRFEVYMWWVPSSNRPDAAPVTVTYDSGCQTSLTVNQSGSSGANQWNLLAVVDDPLAVTLSGADAGYTTADAVRFVRAGAAGAAGCP